MSGLSGILGGTKSAPAGAANTLPEPDERPEATRRPALVNDSIIASPLNNEPPTIEYPVTDPAIQYAILHEQWQWSSDGAAFLVQKIQDEPEHEMSRYLRKRFFQQELKRKSYPRETPKASISTDLRWSVWERDDFTCVHCGKRKRLSVDHIIPESKGGPTELGNLQTLCQSCNSIKGDR